MDILVRLWPTMDLGNLSPATHNIAVTAEDFGETADDDIGVGKDVNVQKVANRLIDHDAEVVLVRECANAWKVGRFEERITGELAEQR